MVGASHLDVQRKTTLNVGDHGTGDKEPPRYSYRTGALLPLFVL